MNRLDRAQKRRWRKKHLKANSIYWFSLILTVIAVLAVITKGF